MGEDIVSINRAPVLTLWAAVAAEQLGHNRDTALTFGKAVAGLNAQSKGRMLGIYGPPKAAEHRGPPKKVGLGEEFWVEICGRGVPAKNTEDGIRAVVKDKPIAPEKVQQYLESKFAESLPAVRKAMETLASAYGPEGIGEAAYGLYEQFRPKIAPGKRGWGQKGQLSLALIRALAERA